MSPQLVRTVAFYLAFVTVGMATASFGPGIPSFARNTGETLARVGVLFVFHRIGYISGSLGVGRLFDRSSGTLLTGMALLLISIGLLLLPLARSVELLWGFILLVGLAQGSTEVGANTGVVKLWGAHAGPAMNGLHLSYGVGAIVAPLVLLVSIGRFDSVRYGYWVLAGLTFAAAICVLMVPEQRAAAAKKEAQLSGSSVALVALLTLVLFATIAGEASIGGWIYSYSVASGIGSPRYAGYLNSGFWAALTLGRLVGIDLVRRLGVRTLILSNTLGAVIAMTLFLLVPANPVVVAAAVVLLGLAQASIAPAVFTFAGQLNVLSGRVAGLFVAGASSGAMTLPWLVGHFFDTAGPISFVWLVWGSQLVALAAFCAVMFAARRKRSA